MASELDAFFSEISSVEAQVQASTNGAVAAAVAAPAPAEASPALSAPPPAKRAKVETVVASAAPQRNAPPPMPPMPSSTLPGALNFGSLSTVPTSSSSAGVDSSTYSAASLPPPPPLPSQPPPPLPSQPSKLSGLGGGLSSSSTTTVVKKRKPVVRKAAGKTWVDNSLDEWPEGDFRLFAGDLGNEVTDDLLSRAFSRFPSFAKAKVIRDSYSNKSKGYGFVSFIDPFDCAKALREMNGKYVGNRPVKLRKSEWQKRNIDVVRKKDKEERKRKAKLGLI